MITFSDDTGLNFPASIACLDKSKRLASIAGEKKIGKIQHSDIAQAPYNSSVPPNYMHGMAWILIQISQLQPGAS